MNEMKVKFTSDVELAQMLINNEVIPNDKHADEVKEVQNAQHIEEEDWRTAIKIDSTQSYKNYIDAHPNGLHVSEAIDRIANMLREYKESIIRELSDDRNAYPLNFIKAAGITREDLIGRIKDSQGNIRDDVLKSWDIIPKDLSVEKTPTHILKGSKEIYFWGVSGSGKGCLMAAILSRAHQIGCFEYRVGEGLRYMNELSTLYIPEFNEPAVCLPVFPRNVIDNVPIRLNSENISLIKIPGSMIHALSKKAHGLKLNAVDEENFELLVSYLQNKENPKYHCFCIDGTIRDSDVWMYNTASSYLRKSGFFNMATVDISLIVTKCDLLSPNREEWCRIAGECIANNYSSLIKSLKTILSSHDRLGLGDGLIKVIPFSIGEVFFQQMCFFDSRSADILLHLLMSPPKPHPKRPWWFH